MTVNEKIIQTLEPYGFPVCPDLYTGTEKKYFTFSYADDRGGDFGDDRPNAIIVYMMIRFSLPLEEDYMQIKKEIRSALFQAGFTYPTITEVIEIENKIRNLVYECEIESEE